MASTWRKNYFSFSPISWTLFVFIISLSFLQFGYAKAEAKECTSGNSSNEYTFTCTEGDTQNGGPVYTRTTSYSIWEPSNAVSAYVAVTFVTNPVRLYGSGFDLTCGVTSNCGSVPLVPGSSFSLAASLRSTGGDPNEISYSFTVHVRLKPSSITVGCSASPATINVDGQTTLTGTGADPSGGIINHYSWNFGDGQTADAAVGATIGTGQQLAALQSVVGAQDSTQYDHQTTKATLPFVDKVKASGSYGNNGGPTYPQVSVTANPSSVVAGQSTTVSWNVVTRAQNTFAMTATNSAGQTASATITIPVFDPNTGQLISDAQASNQAISQAGTTSSGAVFRLPALIEHARAQSLGGGTSYPPTITMDWGVPGYGGSLSKPYHYSTAGLTQGVTEGQTVEITWKTTFANSVSANFTYYANQYDQNNPYYQPGSFPLSGDSFFAPSVAKITSNFVSGQMTTSGSQSVTPTFGSAYTVTVTDADGKQSATAVPAVIPPPVTHTYTVPGTHTITVTATSTYYVEGVAYTNTGTGTCSVNVVAPTYTVSGMVFDDANGNGAFDNGETKVAGQTITLTGGASKTATTDANGNYQFADLYAGAYQVTLTVPSDWQKTTPDPVSLDLQANKTVDFGIKVPAPTVTLTATPATISPGASATLRWSSTNATSVTKTVGFTTSTVSGTTDTGPLDTTTQYSITVQGPGGNATANATVTVGPSFSVCTVNGQQNGVTVPLNSTLTFAWQTKNATAVTLTDFSGNLPPTGNQDLKATQAKTYTLTATGPGGTATCDLKVGITNVNVVGDVFSGSNVGGLNIDPSSVVAAIGQINIGSLKFGIPGYQPSGQTNWATASQEVINNLNSLEKQRPKTLGSPNYALPNGAVTTTFNLNPANGDPTSTNLNLFKPEGGVWVVNGDLTITAPMNFRYKGTIIVNGKITITGAGAITVDSGSLGLAALGRTRVPGEIDLGSQVTGLKGIAFFAKDSIQIQ